MNNEIIRPAILEFERLFLEVQQATEEEFGEGTEIEYQTSYNTKNNVVIEVKVFREVENEGGELRKEQLWQD